MPPDRHFKVNPPVTKPYRIPKLKSVVTSTSVKQQSSQQPPVIRKVQVRSVIQEPDLRQEIGKISKRRQEKEKTSDLRQEITKISKKRREKKQEPKP